jgi:hypothetical protein
MSQGQIFTAQHPCKHSRINILQWILTKLGTYLDLKRIWNHIDFQGQRSRSQDLIFRWGDTPPFARTKHVPSLVKIHWRILILDSSQGCYAVKIWPGDLDLWPWKSIAFQTLLRTKHVPSLVKIHWRMLILECSQGCYAVKIWPLDHWPWKSIVFRTLLRTMYVPSLVKIHWRMLILECSQGFYAVKIWPGEVDLWPMSMKVHRAELAPHIRTLQALVFMFLYAFL